MVLRQALAAAAVLGVAASQPAWMTTKAAEDVDLAAEEQNA